MPAISRSWMDSSGWHQESLDWVNYAYQHLLAPQVNVKGRMAVVVLCAIAWAFGWLLWRAYSVIQTPNEDLVEKLGLDIPPAPIVTLEEISYREVQIGWKPCEASTSIQEYQVEINGAEAGKTKKTETAAVILGLLSGNIYDIRVFSVSPGRFKTPSSPLHIRVPQGSAASYQDGPTESFPVIRPLAARPAPVHTPPTAPAMTREHSGGQPSGRRGTTGRKASPAGLVTEVQTQHIEHGGRSTDDEYDGDLVELSQRFQKVQQDIEATELQIQEEDKEYDAQSKELEARRDKLRHDLKKRDEESSDLRKQVHKAETQNRALLSDKSKKERELQQKENERRQKKDEIAKWEEQIATMAEEIAGIETQKAAIQRRAQSDIREVKNKIAEGQKEVAILEEENKEKALAIKALEEERKQLNVEDETDDSREADRLQHERDLYWKQRFQELQSTYTRMWHDLQQTNQSIGLARERLALYENARRHAAIQFAPAPLDLDAARRGIKPMRRPRHTSSHGSSVSSPRGPYAAEPFQHTSQFVPGHNASPTTHGPTFFNPSNGMTLIMPSDIPNSTAEESEPISSVPMSPHADALLPADLLGDESADEIPEDDELMPTMPSGKDAGMMPFPKISSPIFDEEAHPVDSPSADSSSGRSFSSPREAFAPVPEADRKSIHSGKEPEDKTTEDKTGNTKRLMQNLFSFNSRARGKTSVDQGPPLGSLKSGQSQSFPRNYDDLEPQPRRRLSYGGNWAFPSNFLSRSDKDLDGRLPPGRRALPSFMSSFGKSSEATASYDPFAARTNSFDPGFRGDSDSPRPSSIYSFDKMPRPSMESQFHAWNMDKPAMRNSPLAPDWGSLHSFSRSHSRRPSVGYGGSTSNLSVVHPEEEIVEPRRESRPLQAPIGTRPASSQRPSTPKLNPAAPSFTMLFKGKSKDKSKLKEKDIDGNSPPESRKSKDTPSLAPTTSTMESRESLDRITSHTSAGPPGANDTIKPTLISRISRKASSNKFGSWKDKSGIFSRKDNSTPTGDVEDDQHGSTEHLGKSLESTSTTPSGEDKKASRTSLSSWNFMRKGKKGLKDDLAASEVSESSERASEIGEEVSDDDVEN